MSAVKPFPIFALLLIACSSNTKSPDTVTVVNDSLSTQTVTELRDITPEKDTTILEVESDCTFNDDYKGLTSEWLIELKKTNFIWRDDLKQALIPLGHDTIFISKGGCDHFGTSVELKLTNDFHTLTDSTFWIDKALELVTEYDMENYSTMIKERRVRQAGEQENQIWYEVDDDNEEDFQYYNGIEIVAEGNIKRISISQYIN